MTPNENRELIFFSTILTLLFIQRPIEMVAKRVFMIVIPTRKFPIGSELRETKA